MAAIRCCFACDRNSNASIERTRGIGETLSGESSSDVEDDELLLASFAARFPLKRLGLYGLKMVRKDNQISKFSTGMFLLIFTCSLQIWSLQKLSVPGLAAVRIKFIHFSMFCLL